MNNWIYELIIIKSNIQIKYLKYLNSPAVYCLCMYTAAMMIGKLLLRFCNGIPRGAICTKDEY